MAKLPNRQEPRLTALLRELSASERNYLIHKLGVHRSTFFRWQNDPGSIPWDGVITIKDFLDKVYGRDHDMNQLRKPAPAKRKRVAA